MASIPSRTTGWSSTHNTRIFLASFMNSFRPACLFGKPFSEAESAVPHLAWAFESTIFQLGNAIYLPSANRSCANHPDTPDAPEPTNRFPYLYLRDFE